MNFYGSANEVVDRLLRCSTWPDSIIFIIIVFAAQAPSESKWVQDAQPIRQASYRASVPDAGLTVSVLLKEVAGYFRIAVKLARPMTPRLVDLNTDAICLTIRVLQHLHSSAILE